jgi:hypothetical protein
VDLDQLDALTLLVALTAILSRLDMNRSEDKKLLALSSTRYQLILSLTKTSVTAGVEPLLD